MSTDPASTTPSLWRRTVSAYIDCAFGRPRLLVGGFVLLAVVAALFARQELRVVTDLKALLPEETRSVQSLGESRRRIGSTDFFVIAIRSQSKDIRAIAKMQDRLAARIEQEWSDAAWVQVDRDTDFFKDRALYYLPEKKLKGLEKILREELIRRSAEAIPGMVNLMDDGDVPPIEAQLEKWMTVDELRALGMPPQIEAEFLHAFEGAKGSAAADGQGELIKPPELRDRLIGPLSDVGVVLVQLNRPSTDLDYARFALTRGKALIESIVPQEIAPDLEAQVVGAYRSFKEVDSVSEDGTLATAVSVGSVLLLLAFFFRSVRSIVMIFVPLTAAGAYTMGITALLYGRLTLLTVFVLAMLAGMGIDYGIHFLGKIIEEIKQGSSPREACRVAALQTGSALLAAAATTIASLLVLQTGHFEGFKEFGVVASVGLLLSVLTAVLMIPPLVALFPPRREASSRSLRMFTLPGLARFVDGHRTAMVKTLFGVAVALTLILGWFVPRLAFEHDFRNLRGPKTGATIGYGRAIGKNASTTPSIILGDSVKQMEAVHGHLLARLDDPSVHSFITVRTFVPRPSEQEARQPIIARIHELVEKRAFSRGKGDAKLVEAIRRMSASQPFSMHDLPDWAKRLLTERDGSIGKTGHLYANVKDWDASSVDAFKQRYEQIPVAGGTVSVANSVFILADIVKMVKADGKQLLLLVSGSLLVLLFIFTRGVMGSLSILLTVAAGALWTAGAMALMGWKIGLYNMITIPVILGVGIDSAIHLFHRHRAAGIERFGETMTTTGMLISAGSWTTICGFSGLLFVSHLGLRTIGLMACLGVAMSWLAALTVLPFLLTVTSAGTPSTP